MPVGAPFTASMVASRDVTLRSEFYNDWAHPNGLDQCLFSVLIREGALNGSVCISRSAREGDFEQPHIELLALLVSHLQRAAYAQIRLAQAANERAHFVAALDRLRQGVVLVTSDGTVRYANPAAQAIAAEGDGMRIERGRLRVASPALTTASHHFHTFEREQRNERL